MEDGIYVEDSFPLEIKFTTKKRINPCGKYYPEDPIHEARGFEML